MHLPTNMKISHYIMRENYGVLCIKAYEDEINKGEEYWRNLLLGYFVGFRPSFHAIKHMFILPQSLLGFLKYFQCKLVLFHQDDLIKVMESFHWCLHNELFILYPWDCESQLKKNNFSAIPF